MKIKTPHQRIDKINICLYCRKPLNKGIENKRGICFICNAKYNNKTKLKQFM